MCYDLEPWKRPTGLQENVVPGAPKVDSKPAPDAPARDTDRVSLEIHTLDAEYHQLIVEPRHAPHGSWQYNPSICVHDGRLVASVRLYLEGSKRANVLGVIDESWALTEQRVLQSRAEDPPFKWLPGYEDLRLISRNGRLQAFSSVCARTQDGRFRAVAAMLELSTDLTTIDSAHYQESKFAEKNWMPLVQEDGLRFVYQTEPFSIVLRWDDEAHRVTPEPPGAQGMIRGGTAILPLPDGRFLACVHENRAPAGQAIGRYVHRFVLFDRFLQLERKSEMFVFKETGIEFCAGMALWNGRLVLSFGLQDKQAWLAVTTLEKALETVGYAPVGSRSPSYTLHMSTMGDRASCASCGSPFLGCQSSCPCKCGSYEPGKTPMQYDLEPQKAPKREPLPGRLPEGAEPQAAPLPLSVDPPKPRPVTGPRVQSGPSDSELFTKIIPELLGWCSETKARRLAELVQQRNARTVVEVGVFGGRSLLALGAGARRVGAEVVGIDPYTADASLEGANSKENDAWWKGVDYEDVYRRASAAAALVPGVSIVRGKSLDVAVTYDAGSVDLLHIDGNHSEETSCTDVRAWLPKLSLGAIIVMDDVGWETTKKAQALLAEAGCEMLEKYVKDGESWAAYQCVGARLKTL